MTQNLRSELIKKHDLTLVNVYDTFDKTNGQKDVCLCQMQGQRVILRIGEIRAKGFAESGYSGKNLIIPKILHQETDESVYEIEEYFEAPKIFELNQLNQGKGIIKPEILELLFKAFWEFQKLGMTLPLEPQPSKIREHYEKARILLTDPQAVLDVVEANQDYWNGAFPSKWKFAMDNLLYTNDNRIVFIDNAKPGLRPFGYDLGWIIWPLWVEMDLSWMDAQRQMDYLEVFFETFAKTKPQTFKVETNPEVGFWLTVFERIVGALFDLENDTRHLVNWNLNKSGDPIKRRAHAEFLNKLMQLVMQKVKTLLRG